jgi:hypothetical protein
MRGRIVLLVAALAVAVPTHAENTYVLEGVDFGPQLITPLSTVSIVIKDAWLRAKLHEPFLSRLREAGVGVEHAHHVLRVSVRTREATDSSSVTAVVVELRITEPVRVWQGGRNVAEYPEFTVWQAHELLLVPARAEPNSQELLIVAAAERLLAAFLGAVKHTTPYTPTILIPTDCPDTESKAGA